MKKLLLLIAMATTCKIAYAQEIEFKAGYFFFGSSKMREVYDQGGWDFQICGSYPIWKWIEIYGAVEYLGRKGHSLGGNQRTHIWEVPLSLGIKAVAKMPWDLNYYITVGPRYFFVHVHNNSPYVDRKMNENGCGGFVGTGFQYVPCDGFILDLFGEYSYKRLHFHPSKHEVQGHTVQVGGYTFGGGIGYAF